VAAPFALVVRNTFLDVKCPSFAPELGQRSHSSPPSLQCQCARTSSNVIEDFDLKPKLLKAGDGCQEGDVEDLDTVFDSDDELVSGPSSAEWSRVTTLEDLGAKPVAPKEDIGVHEHTQKIVLQVVFPLAVIVRNTFLEFKCLVPRMRPHSSPPYSRT